MFGVAGFEAAGSAQEFRFLLCGPAAYSPATNGPAHVDRLVGMGLVLHPRGEDLSPGTPVVVPRRKVASINLQDGHKLSAFGLPFRNVCRTWKPFEFAAPGRGRRPWLPVPPGTHRSSPPHIPTLPVRTHLHPTLPQAPAGEVRWAERHDGKRDLYFQHAA